jgi:hypothetical protein
MPRRSSEKDMLETALFCYRKLGTLMVEPVYPEDGAKQVARFNWREDLSDGQIYKFTRMAQPYLKPLSTMNETPEGRAVLRRAFREWHGLDLEEAS